MFAVPVDELADDVELGQRRDGGFGFGQRRADVHRPELAADPTAAQPHQIGMPSRVTGLERVRRDASVVRRADPPREIVVSIDERMHFQQATHERAGGHVTVLFHDQTYDVPHRVVSQDDNGTVLTRSRHDPTLERSKRSSLISRL